MTNTNETATRTIEAIERDIDYVIAERNEAFDELDAAEHNEEIAQWWIDQLHENIEELNNEYWELQKELDAAKQNRRRRPSQKSIASKLKGELKIKNITTKIAKNGVTIFYADGKRISRETAYYLRRKNSLVIELMNQIANEAIIDATDDYAITAEAQNVAIDSEIAAAENSYTESIRKFEAQ